ncbi:N-acetylmuramoyl-L-alanine amidase [Symbiobacterium thermophilum]|uniref:N-acetylmuramoyl-L-alanine amidase n=1 Tax=Symbiobacterium thermophilum TaxID=2734 RepID=A0A953IC99_SYMTR|nr:N-acetylmuramoyl-L-alanine amidase [Symbiobacterium thermophilum]MBY6278114.1 N-acetylmuramoyl-L-alanine amidase [Symbiobacterium thermophilum]
MKKIFWDKGHGGSDPGAVANGLQEKVLTHKIVEYGMDYLQANYTGFEQRVSRAGDQTLTLSQRAKMANDWGADVFISTHINAGKGTGFESYIYNGGVSSQTVALQNVLHGEILAAMRQFGNVVDRGKKRANYAVLRETKMPAVLTENLFIDSNDAKLLKNEEFLKAVGEAHARGIAKFLGLPQKAKTAPSQPQQKASAGKLYRVQVGAFSDRKNAERLAEELKKKGYPAIIV